VQKQFLIQEACKWIVSVLRFAYDYDCEGTLADELLTQVHEKGLLPDLTTLQQRYLKLGCPVIPDITVEQHSVESYDNLLVGKWAQQEVAHV